MRISGFRPGGGRWLRVQEGVWDSAAWAARECRRYFHLVADANRFMAKTAAAAIRVESTVKEMRELARDDRRTKGGKPVCRIEAALFRLRNIQQCMLHRKRAIYYARQEKENLYLKVTGKLWGAGVEKLTSGAAARRLDKRRKEEILAEVDCGTHGRGEVEWVTRHADARVDVERAQDWNLYKGRHKGRPALVASVTVKAQRLQRADMPGGERAPDGLLTLAADRVPFKQHGFPGVIVWRARWAVKENGIHYRNELGVIAEYAESGATYHLVAGTKGLKSDYERAVKGLLRKIERRGYFPRVTSREVEEVDKKDPRPVDWHTAKIAGLCSPGVRNFCARHLPGVKPRKDSVPLGRLLHIMRRTGFSVEARAILSAVNHRDWVNQIIRGGR